MRTGNLGLLMLCAAATAEVIDRIAVTVATQAITLSELRRQSRIAAFPKKLAEPIPADALRRTAERVVYQRLVEREMELSRYPAPAMIEAEREMEALIKRDFPSDAEFAAALKTCGISREELQRHLLLQITTLRFIEYRFRPGVQVSAAEVEAYHAKNFAGQGISLDDARRRIEAILVEQRINEALDKWLRETRTQTHVEFHPSLLE